MGVALAWVKERGLVVGENVGLVAEGRGLRRGNTGFPEYHG